jgi:hypothetical protein
MEFAVATAVLLAGAALFVLAPRPLRLPALVIGAVYAAALGLLVLVLPALGALAGSREELRASLPSPTGVLASIVGSILTRAGVALMEGLLLARLTASPNPRGLVLALGAALPALAEVLLQAEAIRTVSAVLPPLVVANLLLPEVLPPLLAGLAASALAARRV